MLEVNPAFCFSSAKRNALDKVKQREFSSSSKNKHTASQQLPALYSRSLTALSRCTYLVHCQMGVLKEMVVQDGR